MVTQDTQTPGLDGESDEDLLIRMSLQGSEPVAAKSAWSVFYDRHIRYVHGHCWEVLDKHLHGRYDGKAIWDMAAGLAADVMIRVFQKAETFQLDGRCDPDQMRRRIRAWLGGIAHNITCDWLSSRGHESGTDAIEEVESHVTDDDDSPDPLRDCVKKLIDALPYKEHAVVLAYMDFYSPRKGGGRISNEESKQLAQSLNLTTASLRQVKRRTFQRLKEEIESKCMGKDTAQSP